LTANSITNEMTSHSDELSLFQISTNVDVVVVAKDNEDAYRVVRENFVDIVDGMDRHGALVVGNMAFCQIEELEEDHRYRGYQPHGDDWGIQETAEYYTTVEKNKRLNEETERNNKIQALIESLDEEETRLLEEHFLGQLRTRQ